MGSTMVRVAAYSAMSCGLLAQTFEAASVKPRDPSAPLGIGCVGGPGTKDPLLYRCTSASIAVLAHVAYDVPFQDMDVTEQWIGDAYSSYDLQAAVPNGSTENDLRIMLRSLLSDRFHLKWHREVRELDSYILTAPRPKIRQSSPGTRSTLLAGSNLKKDQPVRILARGMTMPDFANLLVTFVQKRVVNETNLEGAFDFDSEFVAVDAPVAVEGPSVFAALNDLGLSLKAGKEPVNVFVIDSADRVPTPN